MRLVYDPSRGTFDFALTPAGGLDAGIGNGGALEAAVWVSIFTDLQADESELRPDLGTDRRGWWGDSGRSAADSMGSLVWLHMRERKNETTRLQVENAARASLQWLVDDGVASDVTVAATLLNIPRDALRLAVALFEPNGVRRDWQADILWAGVKD